MAQSLNLNQLKAIDMHDDNWTVHDKLAMYRGLVKIYNREQSNQINDSMLLKKHNYKKICYLREQIRKISEKLSLAEKGGITEIITSLQGEKALHLSLQHSSPKRIISELDQKNMDFQKILDKLTYKIKKAENCLVEKQVKLYAINHQTDEQDFAKRDHRQMLYNQIQEYNAKIIAGRNIQALYQQIINILRKDQGYYGAVLGSLKENAQLQHICIIRSTEMGQLATEEVANMKEEYRLREHDVRANMEMQMRSLHNMEQHLQYLQEESQSLIRSESFTALGLDFANQDDEEESELEKQVSELHALLKRMQNAILVPDFSGIFPRMLEQLNQNQKLMEDLEVNDTELNLLLKKISHAHLILTSLITEGESEQTTFTQEKERLEKELKACDVELTKIGCEEDKVGHLMISIKNGLHRVWNVLQPIPGAKTQEDDRSIDRSIDSKEGSGQRSLGQSMFMESTRRLVKIEAKCNQLKWLGNKKVRSEDRDRALAMLIRRRAKIATLEPKESKKEQQVSLHLTQEIEDPTVPTRDDVKAESLKLFELATANPYEKDSRKK